MTTRQLSAEVSRLGWQMRARCVELSAAIDDPRYWSEEPAERAAYRHDLSEANHAYHAACKAYDAAREVLNAAYAAEEL